MKKSIITKLTIPLLASHTGKEINLVAQPADATKENLCDSCYYEHDFKGCRIAPVCTSTLREDNQDVIWVELQKS